MYAGKSDKIYFLISNCKCGFTDYLNRSACDSSDTDVNCIYTSRVLYYTLRVSTTLDNSVQRTWIRGTW